jgi:hypothetical protein
MWYINKRKSVRMLLGFIENEEDSKVIGVN